MQIIVYDKSLRAQICEEMLRGSQLLDRFMQVIILPIPTTRDGIHVSGSDVPLSEVYQLVDSQTLLIGYGIPEELSELSVGAGAAVCDCKEDERFLLSNARLTAEATLGILLSTERRSISDLSIGVVGYGRIGERLTELLLYFGADVRVFTRRQSVGEELAESGVGIGDSSSPEGLYDLDILINTAPACTFDWLTEGNIPEGLRIIELASGDNLPPTEAVERYPSLPARCYPVTAGALFAESVERFLLLGGFGGRV
ncbi:MAG: hypothetical protein IKC32_02325 [Clostridia bacterium]|nr:hypothetical protein [Clostridia bacterium]